MADEGKCANCGMELDLGSNPTERDGRRYCCVGCANGTGCSC